MKKIYINPVIELVNVGRLYIMAASEKMVTTNSANGNISPNKAYVNKLTQNIVLEKLQMIIDEGDVEIYSDSSLCNDLGFDNLDMVQLIMMLEKTLSISFEDSFCFNSNDTVNERLTVQSVIDFCAEQVEKLMTKSYSYINKLAQTVVIETLQMVIGMEEDDEIGLDNNLCNDLGLDGLDMLEFIMSLEKTFDISIEDSFYSNSDETIKEHLTVQSVVRYCTGKVRKCTE